MTGSDAHLTGDTGMPGLLQRQHGKKYTSEHKSKEVLFLKNIFPDVKNQNEQASS